MAAMKHLGALVPITALALTAFAAHLGTSAAGDVEDADTKAAVSAARDWLRSVDSGAYDASWKDAATLFQKAVTRDQWSQSLSGVRKPLGAVQSREVLATKKATQLPGARDGEYVVIQFRTTFEKKKSAVETVTPMKDGARGWRVSGYYIK
jgi:hypothetical protein